MKRSLRARYFQSLVRLLLFSYLVFAVIIVAFNVNEWRAHPDQYSEEMEETMVLLGMLIVSLPLVLWAAWRSAGQLLSPLRQVVDTAERIRAGNLNERIPVTGPPDELTRVAEALNHAFDRYAAAVARLETFNVDASHQLRTPLAALRATAEVCLQKSRTEAEYRETLGQVLEEAERMQHTVEQLLQLARLEPALVSEMQQVDLRASLCEWMRDVSLLAADKGIRIEEPASREPVLIQAHAGLLRQAFLNVLNNALAATPDGGRIRCDVAALDAAHVAWTVEDSGAGVSQLDRDRLGDRFYRGPSPAGAGSGLGLAIVRQIVALHKGVLEIGDSAALGGARFRVILPL